MAIKIEPKTRFAGSYDRKVVATLPVHLAKAVEVGVVRIGAGTRSPAAGYRTSALHEFALIAEGRLRVETLDGTETVEAGMTVTLSPSEPHAATALSDSTIFYVLVDPEERPG